VVIDSVAFHFRHGASATDFAARSRHLSTIGQKLNELAHSKTVAVVLLNQMTTKVLPAAVSFERMLHGVACLVGARPGATRIYKGKCCRVVVAPSCLLMACSSPPPDPFTRVCFKGGRVGVAAGARAGRVLGPRRRAPPAAFLGSRTAPARRRRRRRRRRSGGPVRVHSRKIIFFFFFYLPHGRTVAFEPRRAGAGGGRIVPRTLTWANGPRVRT